MGYDSEQKLMGRRKDERTMRKRKVADMERRVDGETTRRMGEGEDMWKGKWTVDSGHPRDKKEWWEGKWTPGNNNKDGEKKLDHGYGT
jgi:hypothetical protein